MARESLPFSDQIKSEIRIRKSNYQEDLLSSGQIEDLDDFRALDKRRSQTRMMSLQIADRMERTGERGYHDGQPVSFVGVNSEHVDEIEPFRRNNAIPLVAQEKRSKLLKELMYYVESETRKPGVKFRHWVQHDGPRCIAARLAERWRAQNGRVTNFNESPIARRLGAQIVMRSNEAGSPVKKSHEKVRDPQTGKWSRPYIVDANGDRIRCLDDKGRQTYHPHTHMIVQLNRYLTDDEFSELIAFAQRHFKTPKIDSGALNNIREACKYVVKCDELNDLSDLDFRRYLKATFKRRLVAFYGRLKFNIRIHKHNGQHIKSVYDPKTKTSVYRVRRNPNARVVKGKRSKDQEIADKLTNISRIDETEEEREERENRKSDACHIVAKLAPLPLVVPIREPVLLVRGRVDVRELLEREEVAPILAESQEHFDAACELFEMLHGVDPWEWVNGSAWCQPELAGLNSATESAVSIGSAHNAPVTSNSQCAKRGVCLGEQSEAPVGPRSGRRSWPSLTDYDDDEVVNDYF
jgi:hypothetical protein